MPSRVAECRGVRETRVSITRRHSTTQGDIPCIMHRYNSSSLGRRFESALRHFPVASKLATHVRDTIQKHQMLVPGDRVLVGVSGGADSVCLALVLAELEHQLGIAHLNHGLRGAASDEDAAFTAALA